jgi:hypothetical protein
LSWRCKHPAGVWWERFFMAIQLQRVSIFSSAHQCCSASFSAHSAACLFSSVFLSVCPPHRACLREASLEVVGYVEINHLHF